MPRVDLAKFRPAAPAFPPPFRMQAIEKAYLSSDSDTEHQVDRAHRQQKLRRAQDEQARATLTDSVLREPAGAVLPGGIASLRRNSSAASTPTSASAAAAAAASVSAVASEADSAVARAASLSSVGVEMTVPTPRTRKPLPPVSRGVSFSSDASAGSARPASASASASVPERAPVFPRVHEGSALEADQHGSEDEPAAPPADDDADDSTLRSRKNGRMSVVYVSAVLLSFACRFIRRFYRFFYNECV
jgi:hypothetical protein